MVARRQQYGDRRCLLCTAIIGFSLRDCGRAFKYCRHCITRHPDDVNRDKCRRYYEKASARILEQKRLKRKLVNTPAPQLNQLTT